MDPTELIIEIQGKINRLKSKGFEPVRVILGYQIHAELSKWVQESGYPAKYPGHAIFGIPYLIEQQDPTLIAIAI